MKVKTRSSQALLLGAVVLVAVVSFAAVAVGATSGSDAASSMSPAVAAQASATSLTEGEVEAIMFMSEEEKLAYDVYMAFADLYGQPIFPNIASAEMMHMTAVLGLIEAYELDDPVDDSPMGKFVNEDLQELYDDLIEAGSVDLASALEVGAVIEEVDILDLERFVAGTTNDDIIRVYENLLRGSENHLRAFVMQLELDGTDRGPAHMDLAAYEAILGSGMERGGSPGSGQGGNGECDESGPGRFGRRGDGQHGQGQGGHGRGGVRGQHGKNGSCPES